MGRQWRGTHPTALPAASATHRRRRNQPPTGGVYQRGRMPVAGICGPRTDPLPPDGQGPRVAVVDERVHLEHGQADAPHQLPGPRGRAQRGDPVNHGEASIRGQQLCHPDACTPTATTLLPHSYTLLLPHHPGRNGLSKPQRHPGSAVERKLPYPATADVVTRSTGDEGPPR